MALALVAATATAYAYQYFSAVELKAQLADRVDTKVKVVDRLIKVWEFQGSDGYIRFDTKQFRCVVPTSKTEAIAYLRKVEKGLKAGDAEPPLLALYGKVSREPVFGPVRAGQSQGVVSEQILIVCDQIKRPRQRFWLED